MKLRPFWSSTFTGGHAADPAVSTARRTATLPGFAAALRAFPHPCSYPARGRCPLFAKSRPRSRLSREETWRRRRVFRKGGGPGAALGLGPYERLRKVESLPRPCGSMSVPICPSLSPCPSPSPPCPLAGEEPGGGLNCPTSGLKRGAGVAVATLRPF